MPIANEVTTAELKKMQKSEMSDLFAEQLRKARLPFEREYRFHPTRKWRFDFVLLEKIAIEIEGGVWIRGRHTRGSGFIKDCEKYNMATAMGWRVFRFPTDMVENREAIDFLVSEVIGLQ